MRLPTCSNCLQSRRKCLGYGFRLAWPRKDDKRRTLVYAPPYRGRAKRGRNIKNVTFVNASSDDVRLSYELLSYGAGANVNKSIVPRSSHTHYSKYESWTPSEIQLLPSLMPFSWNMLHENESPALDFCKYSFSNILSKV